MAISKQMFECEYCGKLYKTEKGVAKHEEKCTKNPNHLIRKKEEKYKKYCTNEIEQIRQEATSPEHLIQLVEKFLLSKGIKITFTSYPSNFRLSVRNSHNSPKGYKQNWGGHSDKDGIPRGYPGWSGRWEGSIEVLDKGILGLKSNNISIDNLTTGGSFNDDIVPRLWFIQTGSGSCGHDFSMDGMLWLYDFPKMNEEYEKNNGKFDIINEEYFSAMITYSELYNKEQSKFIKHNNTYNHLESLTEKLNAKSRELSKVKTELTKSLKNKFNKENGKEIPLPPSAFLENNDAIMRLHENVSFKSKSEIPELKGIVSQIESLVNEIETYIKTKPEEFI